MSSKKDVEMKPADAETKDAKDAKDTKEKEKETKTAPKPLTPSQEIKANLALIERAVSTLEPRFTHRVLRGLTGLRRKIDAKVLREVVTDVYAKDEEVRTALLDVLPAASYDEKTAASEEPKPMDIDSSKPASGPTPVPPPLELVPESETYLRLLILHYLIAQGSDQRDAATVFAHETVDQIQALNRRSMDPLAAKVYAALGKAYELGGDLEQVRPLLLAAQRTASLRRDDESLSTLINLLLRNYLHYNLYSQADKLVSKTTFPESSGNPQLARYLYYVGRIRAVQLSYTEAHTHLQQALRRAPSATLAPGFFQTVNKFFVVVELLMGDIPERSLFRHPVLAKPLKGYFEIVQAVRTGSLVQFQNTLSKHAEQFAADNTFTLVNRLRQNVIKTGIRRLSLSYSLISLRDICMKLNLDSEEDAEYIVGKAIRDGVIEGRVNHEQGWMECKGGGVAYGNDVAEAFGRRIGFCMGLHNESVKAMRYPLNAHRKELASAEAAREREKELAAEIADGDLDGADDDDFP